MIETQFIIRILASLVFGSMIGLERQWRHRLAGLRTNALVAMGSTLFVILSDLLPSGTDETRIAAQVVSGIGFLCAGVIMRDGFSVSGLNTAATLWCSAAVGVLTGHGFFLVAGFGSISVIFANLVLRSVAKNVNREPQGLTENVFGYQIRVLCDETVESNVRYLMLQAIGSARLTLQSLNRDAVLGSNNVNVIAELYSKTKNNAHLEQAISRLSIEQGVLAVAWRPLAVEII